MTRLLRCLFIACLLPLSLMAQKGAEDCKDHPLFNRMNHYYIESCKNLYDTFQVKVGSDKHPQPIAGNALRIRYAFDKKSGDPKPDIPAILNYYEQTILPNNGKRVHSSFDEGSYTMIRNGKEYWITISGFNSVAGGGVSGYSLLIMDKKVGK